MPYSKFKKRVRSVARPIRRGARSRYLPKNPRGKRTLNIGNVIKDVAYIKRQLNSEWKDITQDYVLSQGTALIPLKTSPIVQLLQYPAVQGTANSQRVGNKLKIAALDARMRVTYRLHQSVSQGLPIAPVRVIAYWIYFKDPAVVPTASYCFDNDMDGNVSVMSKWNKNNYKNLLVVAKYEKTFFPPSIGGVNENQFLQIKYEQIHKKLNVHMDHSDAGTLEKNRPVLIILSDATDLLYEHVQFEINMKHMYIDN